MKAKDKVKGVTEMTMEKHRFDGFNVRLQRKGYSVQRYVSSNESAQGKGAASVRRKRAFEEAVKYRSMIEKVFADPRSFRGDKLVKSVEKSLTDLGFTIKQAVPA